MNIEAEVENLAALCLRLIDQNGIDSFRPLTCVPSTKQLVFMMDRRGLADSEFVRTWGRSIAPVDTAFLVAYQSETSKFTIDAIAGRELTSKIFDAPDAYI